MNKFASGVSAGTLAIASLRLRSRRKPAPTNPSARAVCRRSSLPRRSAAKIGGRSDFRAGTGQRGAGRAADRHVRGLSRQLPTVTAGGSGLAEHVYIRGLASTTPNLTTAGVAGLAPNVSLYSTSSRWRSRAAIPTFTPPIWSGSRFFRPQGRCSARARRRRGTADTNKLDLAGLDAPASAGVAFTKGGETSYKAEAMLTVPVTNSLALRGVVYLDDQGGYIDNVQGFRTARESALPPAGTVRSNGVPVSPLRGGFQGGLTLRREFHRGRQFRSGRGRSHRHAVFRLPRHRAV